MMLLLLLLISTVTFAQNDPEMQAFIDKELPHVIEKYKQSKQPDYWVPRFKIATRFQMTSISVDNQDTQFIPMSVTMLDIQYMRYSHVFGIFRVFTQTPMVASSTSLQESDIFLQNVNNTTIGVATGGGWYLYDSRKVDTGKGIGVMASFFGRWNFGVANKTIDNGEYLSSAGAEFNLRVEQNFYRNFGMIYGFDIGYDNFHFTKTDPVTELEQSLGSIAVNYGLTIGFIF